MFFEAKDSSKLPWNTTKTGMDMDSPVYQKVRGQMIVMTRQVMDLMDKLKAEKEKDNPEDKQQLNQAVDKAVRDNRVPLLNLRTRTEQLETKFQFPEVLFSPVGSRDLINIAYAVSREKYYQVRNALQVKSTKDVGLKTFEYYCDNEL